MLFFLSGIGDAPRTESASEIDGFDCTAGGGGVSSHQRLVSRAGGVTHNTTPTHTHTHAIAPLFLSSFFCTLLLV